MDKSKSSGSNPIIYMMYCMMDLKSPPCMDGLMARILPAFLVSMALCKVEDNLTIMTEAISLDTFGHLVFTCLVLWDSSPSTPLFIWLLSWFLSSDLDLTKWCDSCGVGGLSVWWSAGDLLLLQRRKTGKRHGIVTSHCYDAVVRDNTQYGL